MKERVKSRKELEKWFTENNWERSLVGNYYSDLGLEFGEFPHSFFDLCGTVIDVTETNDEVYDFTDGESWYFAQWLDILDDEAVINTNMYKCIVPIGPASGSVLNINDVVKLECAWYSKSDRNIKLLSLRNPKDYSLVEIPVELFSICFTKIED